MKLKDKVAVITGASRGIGRAIALELAKEGAKIVFTYYKSEDLAQSLEKEIKDLGCEVFPCQVDTRDFQKAKELIQNSYKRFGAINILVNNAGIIKDKALMMMEKQDWDEVIDTNLNGLFNITRAAIVGFMKQKSGNIINITSVSGIIGMSRQTNYSASKAGIIGFTKSLAREVAAFNIRVNAVAPGFIDTDMTASLKEEYKAKVLPNIPLARFGMPQEVAKLVAFLASDDSSYITGQIIRIDGGMGMQ